MKPAIARTTAQTATNKNVVSVDTLFTSIFPPNFIFYNLLNKIKRNNIKMKALFCRTM
jgi:hypothetical protein